MSGIEYLDPGTRLGADPGPLPDVSVQGVDSQLLSRPLVPRVSLVLPLEVHRPDSVEQLLSRTPTIATAVRRLTFDIRLYRDVLEARAGWHTLAQLVRDPSDLETNTAFRAAIAEQGGAGIADPALEYGDVDVDVCVVGDGDTVAARRRHELGRARLSITPFVADSRRLTRKLAETLGRPRDGGVRRCLEHALAERVASAPLTELLGLHDAAPHCVVPGDWPSESASSNGANRRPSTASG